VTTRPDYDTPSAAELLAAVSGFLEERVAPQMKGHDAFLTRVAMNVIATVTRELSESDATFAANDAALLAVMRGAGETGDQPLQVALSNAIKAGRLTHETPGLTAALLQDVATRVRIEQPQYASLKRVPPRPGSV
jgi:hypothetical protein